MATIERAETFAARGDYTLLRVNYGRELRRAQELARDPVELRRILAEVAPCIDLEHRGGVCPHNLDHRIEDYAGHNTIVRTLKKTLIQQLTGQGGAPMNLLVTRVAAGTSAAATDQTDTQLKAEYCRIAPTEIVMPSDTQMSVFWLFATGFGNALVALQEWAILSDGATDVAGTGKEIARFLQPYPKDATSTLSGQYDLTAL